MSALAHAHKAYLMWLKMGLNGHIWRSINFNFKFWYAYHPCKKSSSIQMRHICHKRDEKHNNSDYPFLFFRILFDQTDEHIGDNKMNSSYLQKKLCKSHFASHEWSPHDRILILIDVLSYWFLCFLANLSLRRNQKSKRIEVIFF